MCILGAVPRLAALFPDEPQASLSMPCAQLRSSPRRLPRAVGASLLLSLLGTTWQPGSVHAGPLFAAPYLSFDAGSYPHSVAIGDLNRDGRADVAIANAGSGSVSVLLGNGDGTF